MDIVNGQTKAYSQIKEMILKNELTPGQKISKKQLVQKTGIGDTPMREAMLRLQLENLITVVPQSGTYISKIDLNEVYQARFVRETLEQKIIKSICDTINSEQISELDSQLKVQQIYFKMEDTEHYFQLDEEFHHYFYSVAHKEFVWDWLQEINTSFNRYRLLRLKVKDLSWENILTEHKLIIEAIKKKDEKLLQTAINTHLHGIDEDVNFVVKSFPDYFLS